MRAMKKKNKNISNSKTNIFHLKGNIKVISA